MKAVPKTGPKRVVWRTDDASLNRLRAEWDNLSPATRERIRMEVLASKGKKHFLLQALEAREKK